MRHGRIRINKVGRDALGVCQEIRSVHRLCGEAAGINPTSRNARHVVWAARCDSQQRKVSVWPSTAVETAETSRDVCAGGVGAGFGFGAAAQRQVRGRLFDIVRGDAAKFAKLADPLLLWVQPSAWIFTAVVL